MLTTTRRVFTIAWRVTPFILRMLWVMMVVNLLTMRFLTNGVNGDCERLGAEWTRRALRERNGLTAYEQELLGLNIFIAWLAVFFGWVMLSHITVFLWRWFWIWFWASILF